MIYVKCTNANVYVCAHLSISLIFVYVYDWFWPKELKPTEENKPREQGRTKTIEISGARTKDGNNGHAGMSLRAQLLSSHWGNSCGVCGQQTSQSHTYKNCRSWSHPCRGFPPFIWPVIHLPGHTVPGLCLNKAHTVPVFSHHAAGRQTELGTYAKVFKGCPET